MSAAIEPFLEQDHLAPPLRRLGRISAIGSVLGARGVRFATRRVDPGAFAATLDRYAAVLRAAFLP